MVSSSVTFGVRRRGCRPCFTFRGPFTIVADPAIGQYQGSSLTYGSCLIALVVVSMTLLFNSLQIPWGCVSVISTPLEPIVLRWSIIVG